MTPFEEHFGSQPTAILFSPGRVNLIGEHTDYNGGSVLPMALPLGVEVSLTLRNDDRVRIISDRFSTPGETQVGARVRDVWYAYVAGALEIAREEGLITGGADVGLTSDLPDGAGLSSSAAVSVGVLRAASKAANVSIQPVTLAKWAQRVENDVIGVPCGIMDQMAVALGTDVSALLLNTVTLNYVHVPLIPDYNVAIVHSGCRRRLSDGRYAQRRAECEIAAKRLGVQYLCLLDDTARLSSLSGVYAKRARHCMTEHRRTLRFAEAMRAGRPSQMGDLMSESHASMRDDFEVSIPQIDRLVETAVSAGALGARLTGGGFGGCIVALIRTGDRSSWWSAVSDAHPEATLIV